jgi:hypothetical protein
LSWVLKLPKKNLLLYPILYAIILTQWYVFGDCVLYDFEHEYKYYNTKRNYVGNFISIGRHEKNKYLSYIVGFTPLLNTIFVMYLILKNNLYYKL